MTPIEQYFQEQMSRIDRLLSIILSDNPQSKCEALQYFDLVSFCCQSMWHLKDWVTNDIHFGVKDKNQLSADIHAEKCLLICSDLANGAKHLTLRASKTGFYFSETTGIHVNSSIFQEFYYIVCPDKTDPYYGMEIRDLLKQCRGAWSKIIDKHHLSYITD